MWYDFQIFLDFYLLPETNKGVCTYFLVALHSCVPYYHIMTNKKGNEFPLVLWKLMLDLTKGVALQKKVRVAGCHLGPMLAIAFWVTAIDFPHLNGSSGRTVSF